MTDEYEVKVDALAFVEADSKEEAERKALNKEWEELDLTEAWDAEKRPDTGE